MSKSNNRNKSTKKPLPDKMNNVFFKHGKLYCLHQFDGDADFALSESTKDNSRILHHGPMTELATCLVNLVEHGSPVPPKKDDGKKRVEMQYVMSGEGTRGWLHTHGMADLGLPELEIRDVPSFLMEDAARLLRHVCRYMQEPGVVVRAGETMALSDRTRFRFTKAVPIPGQEDHYEVERWQLAEIEMSCDECRLKQAELN